MRTIIKETSPNLLELAAKETGYYDYESIIELDDQTLAMLVYAYLKGESRQSLIDIIIAGFNKQTLRDVSELLQIAYSDLLSFPLETQREIIGIYDMEYDPDDTENLVTSLNQTLQRVKKRGV